LVLAALLGGAISKVYPLSMAHAFDYLERSRYVAGASRLLMSFSVGASGGPLICSLAMSWLGPHAFFGYIGLVAAVLAGFVLYRMAKRKPLPVADQQEFVALPRMSPVGATLDPRGTPQEDAAAEATAAEAATAEAAEADQAAATD
jgi:MFS family permease